MEDIHPLKPVIETPLFSQTQIIILWILLALVIVLILAGIFYFLLKKYWSKPKAPVVIPVKAINYKKRALKELRDTKKLIEEKEFKKFYLKVTAILKKYMDGKHQTKFVEMTTDEILSSDLSKEMPSRQIVRSKASSFFPT